MHWKNRLYVKIQSPLAVFLYFSRWLVKSKLDSSHIWLTWGKKKEEWKRICNVSSWENMNCKVYEKCNKGRNVFWYQVKLLMLSWPGLEYLTFCRSYIFRVDLVITCRLLLVVIWFPQYWITNYNYSIIKIGLETDCKFKLIFQVLQNEEP